MLPRGVSSGPQGAGWATFPAGRYGPRDPVAAWRLPPALPPAGDTPTNKRNIQANLSVCTHAPKIQMNTKQQGGISIHVFYCEYVCRFLYVCEWFAGALVCVGVYHVVLQGRHRKAHTLWLPLGEFVRLGPAVRCLCTSVFCVC